MGNAPPSNGNPRDDPRTVPVMGTNGHHPHHGPYPAPPSHQQHHSQKQHPHQHQHSHSHRHGYNSGNNNNNNNNNMQESNSDASMSNVEDGSQHHNQHHNLNQPRKVMPNGGSTAGSSSALSNDGNPSSSTSTSTNPKQQQQQQQNLQLTLANLAAADDDTVPTVFRWEHGGRQVYITGTFNGWSRQIPMHRSGNDFTYIHNLKRGKHAFKFIVDDEWRFAPDQPTVADIEGRINNFIDVTDFKPYMGDKDFEREKAAAYYSKSRTVAAAPASGAGGGGPGGASAGGHAHGHGHSHGHGQDMPIAADGSIAGASATSPDGTPAALDTFTDPDGEVFTHNMPDLDEYTKDPPPLPPHLRHIILNKPPQLSDTAALPVPQHVALNHLYCTAIKDNMMVLGVTQRFRTKFVTTVYYSPELSKT